jgi:hypothetical protein
MRTRSLLIGLASILCGLAIPAFIALWISSSAYRRARVDALLADPALVTGVAWPLVMAVVVSLALTIGGAVVVVRSSR